MKCLRLRLPALGPPSVTDPSPLLPSAINRCHVMEAESFESEATAAVLNEHFVSIKVDREERPDVDRVYVSL